MSDSHDVAWYRDRWGEVMDLLSVSDPEAVVPRLRRQQDALSDARFDRVADVLRAVDSMEQQLDELYREKSATEQSGTGASALEGDTFEQLQALLARKEKMQRELGVSSADAVVEMVEGLRDQLEDLYAERDAERPPSPPENGAMQKLEDELGVSSPEDIIAMVDDLTRQLDELYAARERLTAVNLSSVENAVAMVQSMQRQLEVLYERQERLSEHGVDGVDHALSLIESMESQLAALYEEREGAAPAGPSSTDRDALLERLDHLESKKEALHQKHEALQEKVDALGAQTGLDDPDAIATLIRSMESQLREMYQERQDAQPSFAEEAPLLGPDTLDRLPHMSDDALDDLPVGAFCLDDDGRVQRANAAARDWPGVSAEQAGALQGARFFDDVAPGTDNSLFRGRFEEGTRRGTLDTQFLYTYVGDRTAPTNLVVRLYRGPGAPTCWVLFRRL